MDNIGQKILQWQTDLGSAFLIELTVSYYTPFSSITQTSELKFCSILHNYAKGEMTCSAFTKAYD